MQPKYLWITVAMLSAAVICWGLWIMLKPNMATQQAESLQGILTAEDMNPVLFRYKVNRSMIHMNQEVFNI